MPEPNSKIDDAITKMVAAGESDEDIDLVVNSLKAEQTEHDTQAKKLASGEIASAPTATQRFATGVLNTLPNPVGLLKMFTHPVDTAREYATHQMQQTLPEQAANTMFPMTMGGAGQGAHAGEEMAKGNVAGGVGEVMGAMAPEALPFAPDAVSAMGRPTAAVGRGIAAAAEGTKKISPMVATVEALASHEPTTAMMIAAAPYAAKAAGRGIEVMGNAMRQISRPVTREAVAASEIAGEPLPPNWSAASELPPPSFTNTLPDHWSAASAPKKNADSPLQDLVNQDQTLSPLERQAMQQNVPDVQPSLKRPVEEVIPPSKSSGSQGQGSEPSATPGLTRNDVETIGLNPNNRIKTITSDMVKKIIDARKTRGASYSETYYLEKKLRDLMDADQ